jgi:hypothetical protein
VAAGVELANREPVVAAKALLHREAGLVARRLTTIL